MQNNEVDRHPGNITMPPIIKLLNRGSRIHTEVSDNLSLSPLKPSTSHATSKSILYTIVKLLPKYFKQEIF